MIQFLGTAVFAAGLLLAPGPSYAGDVKEGRALARAWCAQCHIVEANQKQASDIAPPFAQIANDPSKSPLSITAWLTDPHPPMPKLSLTQGQIEDLVAYIEAQKTN